MIVNIVSHVAMGLAMAGMLVPRLKVLPDGVWEAVFVAIALWFTWHGVRFVGRGVGDRVAGATHGLSHYLIHLVMALAMLYMYLADVPASGRAGTANGSWRRPPGRAAVAGFTSASPPVRGLTLCIRAGDLAARRAEPIV